MALNIDWNDVKLVVPYSGETVVPTKFYQTLNQAPRSYHGKYRHALATPYRYSAVRSGRRGGKTAAIAGAIPIDVGYSKDVTVTINVSAKSLHTFAVAAAGAGSLAADVARAMEQFVEHFRGVRPIPNEGIRAGELTGYRLWWVVNDGGKDWLCSFAHRQLWTPGEIMVGDTNDILAHDPIGGDHLYAGVYAFNDTYYLAREAAEAEKELRKTGDEWKSMAALRRWHPYSETRRFAVGTVKMWGDVVEHKRGYRAQFARVQSIDDVCGEARGDGRDLAYLRRRYGVDGQGPPTNQAMWREDLDRIVVENFLSAVMFTDEPPP